MGGEFRCVGPALTLLFTGPEYLLKKVALQNGSQDFLSDSMIENQCTRSKIHLYSTFIQFFE